MNITLPTPNRAQQAIIDSAARFNVVTGGPDSGLTTLAFEILLVGPRGALRGKRAMLLMPDPDSLLDAKRRLIGLIRQAVKGSPSKDKVMLTSGGSITFASMEVERLELWDQVDVLVLDSGHMVDRLPAFWEKDLRHAIQLREGDAWMLGRATGRRGPLGIMTASHGFAHHILPTWTNRLADQAAVEMERARMAPEAFAQVYGGAIVDGVELSASQSIIGADETFLQWCERLAATGLKVDNQPFQLDNRPAFKWIYQQIPSTIAEAKGKTVVLMKCAQVGFTVMEILAKLYMALKFMPAQIGMYLPDQNLARIKSSERFMPIVRTIPEAYRLMLDGDGTRPAKGEGNIMIRNMGNSRFYFLWTSGKGATESVPLDILSLDEVQEMRISDMEKTKERMSASRIRFTLAGSTANWPDKDIHFLYKQGTQHRFHTYCPACEGYSVLDDYFPACIRFDDASDDYRYVCRHCDEFLPDPQLGEWRGQYPEKEILSIHFPQFLSPTISARDLIEAYYNADDMKNFYNRKLGKPYLDPTTTPVNLEMLNACAALGMQMGLVWKDRGVNTFMGIDQMGQFNVVLIAERLPTGHMAIIHAREIYDEDPFAVCDDLMLQYGVQVCVVETLPNYNDAKRFAGRHPGKVFLAGYARIEDEMLRWGDSVPNKQERKTDEQERDRYTVTLDQYKAMQVALKRIQNQVCIFPDPKGLVQEVKDKGIVKQVAILKDVVFLHFTRTALIAEPDEEERKFRRRVVKVGLDPHFSYAFMLLNVAWSRAFGNSQFILPDGGAISEVARAVEQHMPGLPNQVINMLEEAALPDTCGSCFAMQEGMCTLRGYLVQARDPACMSHMAKT